jgi:hypothetical protein
MYQQLWGYKVEDKLYLGVREQKRLSTAGIECVWMPVDVSAVTFRFLLPLPFPADHLPPVTKEKSPHLIEIHALAAYFIKSVSCMFIYF